MLIRSISTTLLEIFGKIIFNSKAIARRIKIPDDNFWRNT